MNNFKKFCFLILVISMIFMVGCVSAVDVEDNNNISSEYSVSDLVLADDQSEDISESDVLSSNSVEPTSTSDTFDSDKLSDETPSVEIDFAVSSYSGRYHESMNPSLDFSVHDNPIEDLDLKITLDGFKFVKQEFEEGYSSWYQVNYTFDPDTGVLHIDKINPSKYGSAFSCNIGIIPTKVGNASILVEWEINSEKKQVSRIIPITMGEADLTLQKGVMPFPVFHPNPVWLPAPEYQVIDFELLGQIAQYDEGYLSGSMWPFPRNVGDTLVWYIRVMNNGPNTAFDINVTDVLPEGVVLTSFKAATGSNVYYDRDRNFGDTITYDDETGVFHIPELKVTQYADLIIYAEATTPGLKNNVARVTSEQPDPDLTNNEDNSSYRVVYDTDVSINKSVWTDNETMFENVDLYGNHVNYTVPKIKVGDSVFWLIFVNNEGYYSVENVTVKEVLPEGLEIVSVDNSTGSYDMDTNVWTIGSLYSGWGAFLVIETKAVKTGNITNHAVVSTTSDEEYLDNNEDNATVIVEEDTPLTNSTDDPQETPEESQEEDVDIEESQEEVDIEESVDAEIAASVDVVSSNETSDPVSVSKSAESTGNPVFLALMALLIVTGNIFRRKK